MDCICVISQTVPDKITRELERRFDVIKLPPDSTIGYPISSHPDMILSQIGNRLLFPQSYYKNYPSVIEKIVSSCGLDPVASDEARSAEYPFDVSLNAAVGDYFIICRQQSASPKLISAARELGYRIVNVRQGYAGCSCIISENTVITSDKGISEAIGKLGLKSLYVSNCGIVLPGYDVGFIGGSGGFFDGTLYFLGNIDSVECGKAIRDFADARGYNVVCLSDDPLTDHGGIKFFKKCRTL